MESGQLKTLSPCVERARAIIRVHGRYRAARLAGLAKDALRHWDQPDWNPKLSTLDKVLSIKQNGKAA